MREGRSCVGPDFGENGLDVICHSFRSPRSSLVRARRCPHTGGGRQGAVVTDRGEKVRMGTLHLLNLRTCSRTISSWAPATAGPWSSRTPRGSFACLFPGLSTAGHLAAAGGPRPPFRQPPSPPISLAYTELTTARLASPPLAQWPPWRVRRHHGHICSSGMYSLEHRRRSYNRCSMQGGYLSLSLRYSMAPS